MSFRPRHRPHRRHPHQTHLNHRRRLPPRQATHRLLLPSHLRPPL